MSHDGSGVSRLLIAFIVVINAAAVLASASLPFRELTTRPEVLFLLVVLAALAGSRPIRIPSLRTQVSASDPFVFTALATLGGSATVAVAIVSVLSAAVGKKPFPSLPKLAFNLGSVTLSAALASWVFRLLGGVPGATLSDLVLPMFAATTTYFMVNTGLVTLVITIDRRESFFRTWAKSGLWTAVSTYTGLTLAACLIIVVQKIGPIGLALGIPPCWLLLTFYRSHKDRLEEQQRQMEQVVGHNTELEEIVQMRTRELQSALDRIEEANLHLRATNDRLEEANRAKSAFLANVSHELRTPLNAIIGFSDLLKEETHGSLNCEQHGFVEDIHDSGVHLLNLINDILDLSKIEAGKLELRREPLAIAEAVDEAATMLRPQSQRKGIQLTVDCALDGMAAEVDPGMFRQIVVNLLSNAVKFTPEGGRVELRARADERDLVVEIRDTGIGISRDHQDRIFDEFFQVDGTYSRNYQGTGLGLALVRRLIHLHCGTISVDSSPDRGSTFTTMFPACLAPAAPVMSACQPGVRSSARPARRTVLVVEDNPINLKLARNLLRSRGFIVLEATSGEEALQVVPAEPPDLILMDIQLPAMDGLEVTRRLKADPETSGIPVIALSAHALAADIERARNAGCAGYITKPIRLNRLVDELNTALNAEIRVA